MTTLQREKTFQSVRERQPTPDKLLKLVAKHGKEIEDDQKKARDFFIRVGVLTANGTLAKPYSSSK
jgi:hypothetical protein